MKNTLLLFLVILFSPQLFSQDAVTSNDISGTWELMEWHNGDDVLRPPAIGGLFALVNGNFSWVVFNLVDGLYQSGYGRYDFPGNNFRYGYDYGSSIINTGGTTAINAEKWPYVVFEPSNGESELVLTSEDENEVQEFVLRKDSLVYKVTALFCAPIVERASSCS